MGVLSGPPRARGAESLPEHQARLGTRPPGDDDLIGAVERAGLVGRGGASFPTGIKWRAVRTRSRGRAVVIANGAEGEPLSRKDRTLMAARPHLVIDGALLAAEAVAARQTILYVGEGHRDALAAMTRAVSERSAAERSRLRVVAAPASYVAGEETAAVNFMQTGVATPTATPPRPYERGVGGRPTLVHNVETLAHVGLIARYGEAWYRSLGRHGASGSVLLTVGGSVARPGVVEAPSGATILEVVELAGGPLAPVRAILLGGYFGGWISPAEAARVSLDPQALRAAGGSLGCGVVSVLSEGTDPLQECAKVMRHLAGESSAQCGPCFYGLRSLAGAMTRIAGGSPEQQDLERLGRWSAMVKGRGACRHPDGAVAFLQSALRVFGPELAAAAYALGGRS